VMEVDELVTDGCEVEDVNAMTLASDLPAAGRTGQARKSIPTARCPTANTPFFPPPVPLRTRKKYMTAESSSFIALGQELLEFVY